MTYDAASDFSATNNPNGAWSYGWSSSLTSTLNLYPHGSHGWGWTFWPTGIDVWDDPVNTFSIGLPAVYYNGTGATFNISSITMQPGQLAFHPGLNGEYSHVRWTTPTVGIFDIAVAFTGIDFTTTDVHVLYNGTSLFDGAVNGYGSTASFSTRVSVGMNDIIDFAVGYGNNNNYFFDSTAITAVVSGVTEDCANGIDDDGDGLVDCDDPECCNDPICFDTQICDVITEDLLSQEAALNNVNMEVILPDPEDEFTCTFNSANLELVRIDSGAFKDKGFFKGTCQITCEDVQYTGEWRGVIFRKPLESQDRNFYLKGAITGGIEATVDGYLSESVSGSENYDKYQATWQVGRLGGVVTSFTINVNGDLSYEGIDNEYPNTNLLLVRDSIETIIYGYNEPGDSIPLSIALTHLRVVREDSPHVGEGFSIISYNSNSGAGQGWTYDRLLFPGMVEMKGLFSSPLYGVATARLDDSSIPRTLSLNIKRIDLGKPPMADLEVRTWGPQRVSPGQTVDYMVEYRNDGVKEATEVIVYFYPDSLLDFVSASSGYYYDPYSHQVNWNLGSLTPRTSGYLNVKLRVPWGLPAGVELDNRSYILDLALGLDTALRSHERNIIGNGINFNRENQDEVSFYNAVANQNHAEWVPLYDQTNPFTGALQTYLAEHDVFVGEGVNGNGVGNNSPITGPFNRGYFDSGGARSAVTQGLKEGGAIFNELYLRTPQRVSQQDVRNLRDRGTKITVYQGDDLIPEDIRAILHIEHDINSGLPRVDKDNTNITINIKGIDIRIHPNWFPQLFGDDVPPLLQQLETLSGGRLMSLELLSNEPGNRIIMRWQSQGPPLEFRITENIQPEEGIDVVTLREMTNRHSDWGPLLFLFKHKYGRDATSEDIDKLREILGEGGNLHERARSIITPARDPNIKYGPSGAVVAGQTLDYRVEFENEGEGIAFGVYFTDTLDEDLDDSTVSVLGDSEETTLEIGPVIQIIDGVVGPEIGPPGTYNPKTRTITWFVSGEGEIGPNVGGYADISVNVRGDAPRGTEIINYGTVYFPSVPEETRTNAIVSRIPLIEDCSDGIDNDEDGLIDCEDPECFGQACVEVCDDGMDNDGDGFVDCADTDCPPCQEICDDGLDNDRDGLIDCDDPDCTCCDSTEYGKGTSSITFKGGQKDSASLQMCVNRAFCDALRQNPKALILRLDDCNEITIPGNKLRSDRSKTRFSANSSTYKLVIDCKKGVLSLRLGKVALKACVSNPVKMCVSIKDGPCLCAEGRFVEKRDRKGNLIGLSLNVKSACPR